MALYVEAPDCGVMLLDYFHPGHEASYSDIVRHRLERREEVWRGGRRGEKAWREGGGKERWSKQAPQQYIRIYNV